MQPTETEGTNETLEDRIELTRKILEALEAEKELTDAGWSKNYDRNGSYWQHPNFPAAQFYQQSTAALVYELWRKRQATHNALMSILSIVEGVGPEKDKLMALHNLAVHQDEVTISIHRFEQLVRIILEED